MTKKITIKNCKIINEGEIFESDLLIEEGRISKIDSSIDSQGDVIDAEGLYLMPVSYTHLTLPTILLV